MRLLPPALVKQSLSAHSWIGLLVSALMYIVCLTGTLCVLYPQFERWEQPQIAEGGDVDAPAIEVAFNHFLGQDEIRTEHMYLNMPSDLVPRFSVSTDSVGWFLAQDGSLGEQVDHEWTHFLINAHLYLTMPWEAGIILVSCLGALLLALIVSGFLSHPSIFRDAFHLRLGGGQRMEQVDVHNRLSVWGAPFHILIAVTGAYFGLVIPLFGVVGSFTGQEEAAISAAVFGDEPTVQATTGSVRLERILENLASLDPVAEPFALTVHAAGTRSQFVEVHAEHPNRLIYSETYRFDNEGNYLGSVGFSDGEAGKQIAYSMYYLHFGQFAGFPVQLVYLVLGAALTVVSVTGVNIWLVKRNRIDALNDGWVGLVWGVPVALAATMLTQIAVGVASVALFWAIVLAAMAWGIRAQEPSRAKVGLLWTLTAVIASTLLMHIGRFGAAAVAPAAIVINVGLALTAGFVVAFLVRRASVPSSATALEAQPVPAEAGGSPFRGPTVLTQSSGLEHPDRDRESE